MFGSLSHECFSTNQNVPIKIDTVGVSGTLWEPDRRFRVIRRHQAIMVHAPFRYTLAEVREALPGATPRAAPAQFRRPGTANSYLVSSTMSVAQIQLKRGPVARPEGRCCEFRRTHRYTMSKRSVKAEDGTSVRPCRRPPPQSALHRDMDTMLATSPTTLRARAC